MDSLEEKFVNEIGIRFDWSTIDELIISDANILRPTFGYAFEYLIDEIFLKHFSIKLCESSGDSDIDRYFINNENRKITLQIKTPVKASIKNKNKFNFQLHKTHGKETRPNNLYPVEFPCPIKDCDHEGEPFPDYLIGMHPANGVLVIPKHMLQESANFPGHYADPQIFEWKSKFLNSWGILGFNEFDKKNLLRKSISGESSKFPRVSALTKLNDNELLELFLKPSNFRLLHMNIRGNLREPYVKKMLKSKNVKLEKISISYPKYDVLTSNNIKIQIKGCSKHMCDVKEGYIGTEVMGTHRQGPDRRYSNKDFNYLCIAIDPKYIPDWINLPKDEYAYAFIKSKELPLHPKNQIWGTSNKLYENIKLKFSENEKKLIPNKKKYRLNINFGFKEVILNKIPSEILNK